MISEKLRPAMIVTNKFVSPRRSDGPSRRLRSVGKTIDETVGRRSVSERFNSITVLKRQRPFAVKGRARPSSNQDNYYFRIRLTDGVCARARFSKRLFPESRMVSACSIAVAVIVNKRSTKRPVNIPSPGTIVKNKRSFGRVRTDENVNDER